ncbi:MAG: hypothetical protein JST00_24175 [Deltaproteobacteria bacterium]|nr:hypothetical protein [Deltaproteobacteria bacterium]
MISAATFAVAFVVRLVWILVVQSPHAAVYSDMAGYVARADELLGRAPVVEPRMHAFYPFGTHYLVAAELALFGRDSVVGVAVVHALVGAVPPLVVSLLLARLREPRLVVALGGALAALWPPQISYAGFFMSELWFSAALSAASLFVVLAFDARGPRRRKVRRVTWLAALAGTFAAIAFVVRPQVLLTIALLAVLLVAAHRARFDAKAMRVALIALVPLAIAMGVATYRHHVLTGLWALTPENSALMRLFGETDVARVEARWTTPSGGEYDAWYAAGLKQPYTEANTFRFEGYVGDATILDRERASRLAETPLTARVRRAAKNVSSLVWRSFPMPEADFHGTPFRLALSRIARKVLYVLLALTPVGLWVMRRHRVVRAVVAANLLTVVLLPLVFYAEARYRVPYDPFLVVASSAGVAAVARRAYAWLRARRGRTALSS